MRILLLNTDYGEFLAQMYQREPGLESAPYDEQMRARNLTFFGVADAYAVAFRQRGHIAEDIHVNNVHLQAAWAREHGVTVANRSPWRRQLVRRRGIVPWIGRELDQSWLDAILEAQIEHFRPDIVFSHDIAWRSPSRMREVCGHGCLLIGQHAATSLTPGSYSSYDLVMSSWLPTIEALESQGVHCAFLRLGFDQRVLDHIDGATRDIPVSFVGSLGRLHTDRLRLLEVVCEQIAGVQVWGPSTRELARSSPILTAYQGQAFGIDMFRILARSRVTLNHHGLPEPHANNMRLYEATGVGTTLLTDAKPDLIDLFTPGEEVLTYDSIDDCLQVLRSATDADVHEVALAGQRRTLATHTWAQRVDEILEAIADLR